MIALSLERIAAACRSLNRLPAAWGRWRRPGALALLALLGSFRPAAAQPGKDGARTVATAGAVLNEYTALTADAAQGEAMARQIESGAVFVNGLVKSMNELPFGGVKKSGYGRELSCVGIREIVNQKSVWIGKPAAQAAKTE